MLSLNNDFLGYHPLEHNVNFSGSDTSEVFEKNLKTQPDDWYYRINPISYVRNNNGHRCKNIEEIDLDNYILFAGCSHTEGIGLKVEDTYPYLLSQKLNCDYYNLSLGGTGIDAMNYNLVTWFAKVKKPPKLLVLQWPHHVRVVVKHFENPQQLTPEPWDNYGLWSTKDTNKNGKTIGNFLVSGEEIGFFETLGVLAKKTIYNITPCPIIEVSTIFHKINKGDFQLKQIDSARDDGHMGIKSELLNATLLYKEACKIINITNKGEL